jgi:hypothetical protein
MTSSINRSSACAAYATLSVEAVIAATASESAFFLKHTGFVILKLPTLGDRKKFTPEQPDWLVPDERLC